MAFRPLLLGSLNQSKEPLSSSLTKVNSMIQELYSTTIEGDLSGVSQDIVPDQSGTRDLGSVDKKWRSLYVSGNTIYIGDAALSISTEGNLTVNGGSVAASVPWDNVTGKPALSPVSTSGSYSDLLNLPVLFSGSYNNLSNKPVLFSGSYSDLSNKPVLFSGSYSDLSNKPTIPVDINQLTDENDLLATSPVRTVVAVTATIAAGASANLALTGFKGYIIYTIQTNTAAWIRVYTSVAGRTVDESRTITTDPTPGSGVVAEVITTGAATINMAPAPIGFSTESAPNNNIPIRITNRSISSQNITVTMVLVPIET